MNAAGLHVGDPVPARSHDVDQQTIDAWAEFSGDQNPLHVDPVHAATTRFGTTIAHGHLSLTWLCEALLRWCGPGWTQGGAVTDVRFVGPVRPGTSVRVEGTVVEISPADRQAICDMRVVDEASGDICAIGTGVVPLTTLDGKG